VPLVYAENIVLTHVGFGETPKQVIITIYNNRSTDLENPSLYVDSKLYTNLEMRLPPRSSANYILYIEPGVHEIEIRHKNESARITVNNNIPPIEEVKTLTKPRSENIIKIIAIIILVALLGGLYFLILKKPKLIK
jgi:hypothetical protein